MAQFVVSDFRNVPAVLREKKIRGAKEFARRVGFVMAEEAKREIENRFEVRPFERRRHPGTRRATTAISFNRSEIAATKNFPIEVDFRILGGDKVVTRINVLNNGATAHVIDSTDRTGNEPWELKGVGAVNRMAGLTQSGDRIGLNTLAWPRAGGTGFVVTRKPVNWRPGPAQSKTGFLQAARDKAIQMVRAEFR
jgi:hypothetical protein